MKTSRPGQHWGGSGVGVGVRGRGCKAWQSTTFLVQRFWLVYCRTSLLQEHNSSLHVHTTLFHGEDSSLKVDISSTLAFFKRFRPSTLDHRIPDIQPYWLFSPAIHVIVLILGLQVFYTYLAGFNPSRPPSYGWFSHATFKCRLLAAQERTVASTWGQNSSSEHAVMY